MKTLNATEEKALLERLRHGDHRAFERIYHAHNKILIGSLFRLLKSPELVEEIMQELFLRLWQYRERIDPEKTIKPYLFKIAAGIAQDIFRKAKSERRYYDYLTHSFSESHTPLDDLIRREDYSEQLDKILRLMPEKQRKVYTLCKLEGLSHEEVSNMLGIAKGTVNAHMRKANLFLKEFTQMPAIVTIAILSGML